MLRLRGEGLDWEEVAERLERSVATLKTINSRYKAGKLEKQFLESERRRAIEILAEAGYCAAEIARRVGLNYHAAYTRLRNIGFDAELLREYRAAQPMREAA